MTPGPSIHFETSARYPDPRIEVLDERFLKLRLFSASVEQLASGMRWAEGPVWFGDGRYLLVSDIPNNRIMRWDDTSGQVSEFRKPSHHANGLARDAQGRLLTCEHQTRRVTRTEYDGTITVIADRYQGKRLNSPNDVVVKSDGSIWFTDPAYGIDWDYEGERAESEIGACHVYRVDPASGEVSIVADDFVRPNGIAFSPDETKLYIADTGATHMDDGPRHIRVFDVIDGKKLRGGNVFAMCSAGFFDGFRFDEDGRLWTSAFDGVHCYNEAADLIGKIKVPEVVGNLCFGGLKRNRLYICGTTSLYAYYLLLRGPKTF